MVTPETQIDDVRRDAEALLGAGIDGLIYSPVAVPPDTIADATCPRHVAIA